MLTKIDQFISSLEEAQLLQVFKTNWDNWEDSFLKLSSQCQQVLLSRLRYGRYKASDLESIGNFKNAALILLLVDQWKMNSLNIDPKSVVLRLLDNQNLLLLIKRTSGYCYLYEFIRSSYKIDEISLYPNLWEFFCESFRELELKYGEKDLFFEKAYELVNKFPPSDLLEYLDKKPILEIWIGLGFPSLIDDIFSRRFISSESFLKKIEVVYSKYPCLFKDIVNDCRDHLGYFLETYNKKVFNLEGNYLLYPYHEDPERALLIEALSLSGLTINSVSNFEDLEIDFLWDLLKDFKVSLLERETLKKFIHQSLFRENEVLISHRLLESLLESLKNCNLGKLRTFKKSFKLLKQTFDYLEDMRFFCKRDYDSIVDYFKTLDFSIPGEIKKILLLKIDRSKLERQKFLGRRRLFLRRYFFIPALEELEDILLNKLLYAPFKTAFLKKFLKDLREIFTPLEDLKTYLPGSYQEFLCRIKELDFSNSQILEKIDLLKVDISELASKLEHEKLLISCRKRLRVSFSSVNLKNLPELEDVLVHKVLEHQFRTNFLYKLDEIFSPLEELKTYFPDSYQRYILEIRNLDFSDPNILRKICLSRKCSSELAQLVFESKRRDLLREKLTMAIRRLPDMPELEDVLTNKLLEDQVEFVLEDQFDDFLRQLNKIVYQLYDLKEFLPDYYQTYLSKIENLDFSAPNILEQIRRIPMI
jgi:hypothetical protein